MVSADEGRNHCGIEQLFGQAIDRPRLEIRIVDRPVVRAHRRAALAKAAASPAVLADDRVAVATDAAASKLRQQFRGAMRIARFLGPELFLLCLDSLPSFIVSFL